jgi:hypothetical protein
MSENDAVLIGMKEIAAFLKVSRRKVMEWRHKYTDMPIYTESSGSMLCADKELLSTWQRQLFARWACQATKKHDEAQSNT